MNNPTRTGCVYCNWPRARVRDRAGKLWELPACPSHVDLLELDPYYSFGGSLFTRAADELAAGRHTTASRREDSVQLPRAPLAARPSTSSPSSRKRRARTHGPAP